MFSDEAGFRSTGQLNRHNCHYWSVVNPHWVREVDIREFGQLMFGVEFYIKKLLALLLLMDI